ncbi:hypothetical protein [Nocardioides sp. S5]|uniref:PGN_0703 family putative restriction endonuclease n=1 Tax=Nocardioides sp. S5 TaxID=2017486 RepID=UPI001A8D083F|nr:hypothetical protein [Nocardioides sp. S5]
MRTDEYTKDQRDLSVAWKLRTPTLWPAARQPAPWVNHRGDPVGMYDHCLPEEYAAANLLPEGQNAVDLFETLGIPWHCGVDGGPGNNLLSSQVQCVNALMPMVGGPDRIVRAFGNVLDIAEVLQIEPDRYLTFEYIGPTDYFNEGRGAPRVRGAKCTSLDAAFLYRTSTGTTELALIEWKYTESYLSIRKPNPSYDKSREARYGADFHSPDAPLRSALMSLGHMLDEPFYQLMRQQLLAHRLEREHAEGADVVRVLHVRPRENQAYQQSLSRPEHRRLGDSVDAVWARLLKRPDRFIHVDPAVFCDETVTSEEYVDRYSPNGTGRLPWGVSVWRENDRIAAAAYAYADGFEWCHCGPTQDVPVDMGTLSRRHGRENLAVADDEKTMLVGPLAYARAFLRAIVSADLSEPTELTCYSWPDGATDVVAMWPPVDLHGRLR